MLDELLVAVMDFTGNAAYLSIVELGCASSQRTYLKPAGLLSCR